MKQLESHSYNCCQRAQMLRTESKRFCQLSKQLRLALQLQCQQAEQLRSKSNILLQKLKQLQSTLEKKVRIIDYILDDSNECLSTTEQLSLNDLERRIEWVNELQLDVDERLQTARKLQFNVGKIYRQVNDLVESSQLNTSDSQASQGTTDLTDTKKILEDIDRLIEKIKTVNWLD